MPGSKSEQPVLCTGCPWTNVHGQENNGLPTYPYSGVLVKHVGRYVDSSSVQSYQMWVNAFRTARARFIRVAPTTRGTAPPRVYIQVGNAMMAYSLDTFFTTDLPGGMIPIVNKFSGVGGGRERVLDWDAFVYPEYSSSGWQTDGGDFQDPMAKAVPFDYDDRGNVYVATEKFGWAIVTDDGRVNGTHLPKVIQFVATPNPEFTKVLTNTSKVKSESIVSIKSGGTYYVIIADRDSQMAVFDATTTSRPVVTSTRTGDKKNAMRAVARNDDTRRIAYIDNNFSLRIFDYDALISGAAPIAEYSGDGGKFGEVVSMDDQGNVWAVENNGKIWKLTPSGNTYTKTTYQPFSGVFNPLMMHVNAGYMAIGGIDRVASTYDVKVLRIDSTGVTDLNIDNFFRKYYHQPPPGYAQPGSYTAIQAQSADVEIVKWGGKTYLMYSGFGLGDVFELEGGNSINITMKGPPYGTVNASAKSTEPGPYYGDPVTFTATSSSPSIAYDVQWVFGNPEAGTGNSGRRTRTPGDIIHQFTGITTAGAVTSPKLVQAQTVQDSNIRAQLNVALKLPSPRIGVQSMIDPLTTNVTGLYLVAGESFVDASDGAVEGHVALWNIDGTTTTLEPNKGILGGTIGPHKLTFRAAYGDYDANLNINNPYLTPVLTVDYTVVPFKASINTPTSDGTNVTFTASPFFTANPNVLSAKTWDVVWTVNGTPVTTAGSVSTSAVGETIGTIRPLVVPRSSLGDGTVIGLKINVDPATLPGTPPQYAEFSTSLTLSTPDPDIEVTGCANANSPCKFTARSAGSKPMTGWAYLWTLTRPGASPVTGTAATFEPTLSAPGTYTITLKATKTIFPVEVSKQLTVGGSLCGQLPLSHNVSINKIGCSTSCAPGTSIEFTPTFQGYARQACDVYSWNMGDGSSPKSTETVTHSYPTPGTYTVTLTLSNAGTSTPIVKQTTVTITGTTEPPPTNQCTAPSGITVSATCNGGATCRTSDTVTFTARRGGSQLQSCDNVTWNFGDGSPTSNVRQPQKVYSTAGTYTVSAVVSNSNGTAPAATTQVAVADPVGNCGIAPSISNFVIEFVGPTTNCRQFNGTPCNAGEAIAFSSPNYYYTVGSCDHFEWDFDDGTPKSAERNPTHSFAGGRDYNVKLTVRNGAGSYTYNRTVKVAGTTATEPLPVITPTTFPANGRKGQAVTFVATSNMDTTTGWTWNFGDGTAVDTSQAGAISRTSTISHTFASAGTYTVKVSARNSRDAATAPMGDAQAQIVITNPPAIPEYRYLLPVTAYTAGQGGSAWRTDVQIYNPDPQVSETKPLVMEATFKGITKNLTMIKATHIYENFLGNLLDMQKEDQGPVIITTKSAMTPPHIWTRTYTQTPNGTFGQFIPAIRIDNLGGGAATGDGKYYMSGLRHDARYRTNVGFLNPNAAPLSVTVTVYDAAKFKIADFPLTLQPFQLEQYPLTVKVPNLPNDKPFSVKIEVPAGNWIVAYASSVDAFSNDGVYIQALPESDVASADYKTTLLPGVGHVGQWRSDVTIFNPDPDGMLFDLTYYNSAGEKKAEASVSLDSGKFITYNDILKQGVLGNVDDGLGTLKVTVPGNHEKYPMTSARTYFDNGANGTFGQGIPAFSPARANVKPNQAAIIAGVRNSAAYRTNIGLVNVSSSNVVATVTLLDPNTGAAVKAVQYTIRPAETIVGPFAGTAAQPRGDWNGITTATLKIEANGALWAFASCIDMETQDPEYVVATPFLNQ
ncbi:MAG TPA: PKD domain-containing protein [Thermoanaerobaculia bacterium]|nr:PKD domain-containing protein [Thermoanaerobaculia bacterium]